MGGRVTDVEGVPGNPKVFYVATATGGIWKTINAGTMFFPVFDKERVVSMGDIAIAPSDPNILYAGTGEEDSRNSISPGAGVYKSTDAGRSWKLVGLEATQQIGRIVVDPADPNVVYVAALGHEWNANPERGLYKSTDGGENFINVGLKDSEHIAKILVNPKNGNDVLVCATGGAFADNQGGGVFRSGDGGKTWSKVLAGVNASTGCGMLAASEREPDTIYASTWDFRRQAWTFRSGGPGSGLFKSTDGGQHWTELTTANAKGLPAKPYGRIALAVAPSNPQTVYAMIESKSSALFRSDDGGQNWSKLDASQFMVWRPFYFANLIVDPKDANKVFKVDLTLLLSINGGKSFSSVSSAAHGDFHDVWIDPGDSNLLFAGDDGGLWQSKDGGTRWEHLLNLPVSQFYHVSVDDAEPYHVYGGLQDNSSWVGDSSYPGGITNSRWENMYNGDGFWMWQDPSNTDYIYAELQGGDLGRVNRFTHETRSITPYPLYGEKKLRFNWNTPVQVSPNDKNTLYLGAQFLYRSRDQGQHWDRISPDLTTNNPEKQKQEESGGVTIDNSAAEMNNTVYSISESPKDAQLIWVGTDDGNLQITRDGGKTWTNVAAAVQGVGKDPWVTWVQASRYDAATAYATFDRHMYGDMKPYVYKTTDYGKTWTPLPVQAAGVRGYAHVIKEDARNASLLFLGTEFGLWVSIDGGQSWAQYKGSNFPAVAVRDIVVHPRTFDLVLATHGRGIWIVDDISPLRSLTPELMQQDAAFLPIRPSPQWMETNAGWPEGDAAFTGPARPAEAAIPYYQRTRHIFGDLKIQIYDAQGNLVDTVTPSEHRGVNRATWSMHLKPPHVPPAASALFGATIGPRVLPGVYTIKMTKADKAYTSKLEVVLDPRAKYGLEDRKAQFDLVTKISAMLNHMSWAVDSIIGVRDGARMRAANLGANDPLRRRLIQLSEKADAVRSKIVATKEGGMITGEERLREYLGRLYGDVNGFDGRPTDAQVERANALGKELEDVIREFRTLTDQQLPPLNRQLERKKLGEIKIISEQEWQAAQNAAAGPSSSPPSQAREMD